MTITFLQFVSSYLGQNSVKEVSSYLKKECMRIAQNEVRKHSCLVTQATDKVLMKKVIMDVECLILDRVVDGVM